MAKVSFSRPPLKAPIRQPNQTYVLKNHMSDSKIAVSFLRRSREQSECTQEFIETIDALRQRGQQDVEVIWNCASHVNLISHDLMVLLYFLTTTDDGWACRTAARAIATLIYEGVDDLQHLLGKGFIDACKTAGVFDQIEREYRTTKKRLSQFQNKYSHTLKPIRMTAGAHRDHDCKEFLRRVVDASPDAFIGLSREFEELLLWARKVL